MAKKLVFKQDVVIPETGEVKEAIAVIPEARDKGYAKIFQLFSRKLLEDLNIVNGEAKLLIWFLARTVELPVQSDMWIPVDYDELSRELGVHKEVVKRYIKKLKELQYIEQFQQRQKIFRIKPELVYKGILQKYKEEEANKLISQYYREKEVKEEEKEKKEQKEREREKKRKIKMLLKKALSELKKGE